MVNKGSTTGTRKANAGGAKKKGGVEPLSAASLDKQHAPTSSAPAAGFTATAQPPRASYAAALTASAHSAVDVRSDSSPPKRQDTEEPLDGTPGATPQDVSIAPSNRGESGERAEGVPIGPGAAGAADVLPVTEEEFMHTCNMVHFVAQPALVQVLRSLLEDFPWLVPHVRVRCDHAMAAFLAQNQQLSPGSLAAFQQQQLQQQAQFERAFANGRSGVAGPMDGVFHGEARGFGYAGPKGTGQRSPGHPRRGGGAGGESGEHSPGATPLSSRKNQGRRRGEEEQDMCQRHGNLRATKHLTYNAQSRQVECIPGFHCLETRVIPPPPHFGVSKNAGLDANHVGIVSANPAPSGSSSMASPPNLSQSGTNPASGSLTSPPHPEARGNTPCNPLGGMTTPLLPGATPTSSIPPSPNKTKREGASSHNETPGPMLQSRTPPPGGEEAEGPEAGKDRARLEALLCNLRKA